MRRYLDFKFKVFSKTGILGILCLIIPHLVFSNNKQLDSLVNIASQLKKNTDYRKDSNYIKSINDIAAYYLTNKPDTAFLLAKENETLAQEANLLNLKAEAIRHQGVAKMNLGLYFEAISLLNNSLSIYLELNNEKGQSKVYNNIAVVFKNIGDFSKALEYNYKSLDIKLKLNDKKGVAVSYGNIAILYKNQKKFKESLIYQLRTYRLFKELGDKNGISTAANNLAIIYTVLKNYNKALLYHEESYKIALEMGDQNGIAHNLDNISIIKFNQNKTGEALNLQLQSLKIRENMKDLYGIGRCYIALGDYYKELKDKENAFSFYSKGLKIAEEIGRKELISDFHKELFLLNKENGNFNQAIYHLELHNAYDDSLFNLEVESKTIELNTRHEFEQKAIQLREEKEIEKLNYITKSENQRYIIILISLFIVFLLAFSISLHVSKIKVENGYKKLEEANNEIHLKTEALHKSLMEVSLQKNEINELNFTLQEKVKERTENLEKAYKRLRDFSFANSHQLRKPVANILGLCELINRNQPNDPDNIKIIEMLKESAIELDQIIHHLNTLDQENKA